MRPPIIATASRKSHRRHIVEQHHVGAFRQNLAQLVERVDLDLDFHQMAHKSLGGAQRGRDAAGDGDVVVLDEHRVVEAEAVIGAAAASHRVFLEGAQQRRGLARVADPGLGVGDLSQQSARSASRRRTAAPRKFSATRSAERIPCAKPSIRATTAPLATCAPSSTQGSKRDRRVDLRKGFARQREPGDHAVFARGDHGPGAGGRGDGRLRRDVAGAAEVFGQRRAHGVVDEELGRAGRFGHDVASRAIVSASASVSRERRAGSGKARENPSGNARPGFRAGRSAALAISSAVVSMFCVCAPVACRRRRPIAPSARASPAPSRTTPTWRT